MDEQSYNTSQFDHIMHKELNSVLANERTYAAWIRTGLTSLVAGLGIEKFLYGTLPTRFIPIISMILFFTAACFFTLAAWRYQHVGKRLIVTKVVGASIKILTSICVLLAFVCVFVAIGVIIMH